MSTFELPLHLAEARGPEGAPAGRSPALPEEVLARNALFFCRLRWAVVLLLGILGIAARVVPGVFSQMGLHAPVAWPLAAACVLAVANVVFLIHARSLRGRTTGHAAKANLWAQIMLDLAVLTAVAHFVGALNTPVSFAYLFHIVLACIFFSRRESLVATVAACAAFSACVGMEVSGVLAPSTLYADRGARAFLAPPPSLAGLHVAATTGSWMVVWLLASHLSETVRARDCALTETNRRLQQAQEEKSRHMLRTTHELKAPFAAIHANTELLLKGYCGEIPDPAREVVLRIARRCLRLATEVQEMLHLARLRATDHEILEWTGFDLAGVIEGGITSVQAVAEERRVRIESDLEPAPTWGVADQVQLLVRNIIANAVVYSRPDGVVRVTCRREATGGALAVVADGGIGIPADKLPKIFDEYYHTDEAVRHNASSTGLGLAIVAHVAQTHGIRIAVESEPGAGTTFSMRFPQALSQSERPGSGGRG